MTEQPEIVIARVVLGRKDPTTLVGFQWTGVDIAGLYDPDQALMLGAVWEGDELVTYNLAALEHNVRTQNDRLLEDPD